MTENTQRGAIIEIINSNVLPTNIILNDIKYDVTTSGVYVRDNYNLSNSQAQTTDLFSHHWKSMNAEKFIDEHSNIAESYLDRNFPGVTSRMDNIIPPGSLVLDAGCGSAVSAKSMRKYLQNTHYVGVDLSDGILNAHEHLSAAGIRHILFRENVNTLPFEEKVFDAIICMGVLLHVDDASATIKALSRHLKVGGTLMMWTLRRHPPLRELADAYIRNIVSAMSPQEAFNFLRPLTKLARSLQQCEECTITIEDDVDFIGVKKGAYKINEFIFYHFFRSTYRPHMSLEYAHYLN